MVEAEATGKSLLAETISGTAHDLIATNHAVRDLQPDTIAELATAVLEERGRHVEGLQVRVNAAKLDDPILEATTAGGVRLTIGNQAPDRRHQQSGVPVPDEERRLEVRSHEGLPFGAGLVIGRANDLFVGQLRDRLAQQGAEAKQIGLSVTPQGLHLAASGPKR